VYLRNETVAKVLCSSHKYVSQQDTLVYGSLYGSRLAVFAI